MRQGELFGSGAGLTGDGAAAPVAPVLQREQLQRWQQDLARHQSPLFRGEGPGSGQSDLFAGANDDQEAAAINPLTLRAQPLSFWRWPQPPQQGAALYFVLDSFVLDSVNAGSDGTGADDPTIHGDPAAKLQPLLLYVGETGRADRRWKGEHDCKGYLAAYSEALSRAGLRCQLSIRFWLDVPTSIRARRALEQRLIQRWLPPFNKETRQRWATPFTALAEGA